MLEKTGPFTAPLCFGMAWAIRWLVKDRQRLIDDLKAAHEDAKNIRDKRTEDQRAMGTELREISDVITHRLETWVQKAEKDRTLPGS